MKKQFCVLIICFKAVAQEISLDVYDSLKNVSAPYAYSFQSATGQKLEYIGTCHTSDSTHEQYKTINNRWNSFLATTQNDQVAVIEAAHLRQYSSQEEALTTATDCGYATWLSSQHNVPVVTGELTHKAVIQQLLQEFEKNDVYYFAFAQAVSFALRTKVASLEGYVVEHVASWTGDSTVTFQNLTALHTTFTGLKFKPTPFFFFLLTDLSYHTSFISRLMYSFTLPRSVATKMYPLLRRSLQIRDTHTLKVITDQWNLKKNIFIVYGAYHAAALKKYLEHLTQTTRKK